MNDRQTGTCSLNEKDTESKEKKFYPYYNHGWSLPHNTTNVFNYIQLVNLVKDSVSFVIYMINNNINLILWYLVNHCHVVNIHESLTQQNGPRVRSLILPKSNTENLFSGTETYLPK